MLPDVRVTCVWSQQCQSSQQVLELRKSAADAFKSGQNAEQEIDRRADKHIFKTQIRMTRNDHSKSPFGDRIKTADNIASIIIIVT